MHRSKIEWCRNPDGSLGWVWNPITGCLNGCEYCYARRLANTRLKDRYLANSNFVREVYQDDENLYVKGDHDPFYPRFWPERLDSALFNPRKNRGVFVCDMSDLFGIGIPKQWTEDVLGVISTTFWNRYYLLTKQPQNLIKFNPFPDNCWVGVTATDRNMALRASQHLIDVEAKVKYLSIEPLLDWVLNTSIGFMCELHDAGINQVIMGSQTKPYKPPKIEWVQEIVEAADKAGVKVFLKDNLKPLLKAGGWKIVEHKWITVLRQEMPDS